MLVSSYAAEVAHTAVRANLYNPGPMRTAMRQQAFPGEDPKQQTPPEAHADVQTTMKYLHYAPREEDARLVAEAFELSPSNQSEHLAGS